MSVAEEGDLVLVRQVHLAEQDGRARATGHERAQAAQELVRGGQLRVVRTSVDLDQVRHGVDPEPVEPELHPEPDHLRYLVADGRVLHVEVGLMGVEPVLVVLPGAVVQGPDRVLLVREDDLVLGVGGRLRPPDVVVAVGVVLAGPRRAEPRVGLRGVVDHEVGDHTHPAILCGPDQLDEVAEGAEALVDAVVVGDVVPVVPVRGGVERHQPQARHAEVGEVVDLLGEPAEVPDAVGVRVPVGLDVQAVDHRVLPPQVGGLGDPHRVGTATAARRSRRAGRRRSALSVTNGSCSWLTWCR